MFGSVAGARKNKNGITTVPSKRPAADCVNKRSGRPKRTFYDRLAAEAYLGGLHATVQARMEVYACAAGHFHLTTRQGWQAGTKDGRAFSLHAADDAAYEPADIREQQHTSTTAYEDNAGGDAAGP